MGVAFSNNSRNQEDSLNPEGCSMELLKQVLDHKLARPTLWVGQPSHFSNNINPSSLLNPRQSSNFLQDLTYSLVWQGRSLIYHITSLDQEQWIHLV